MDGAEPGAAPDRGRITVSRDIKLLQRPRQVSMVVMALEGPLIRIRSLAVLLTLAVSTTAFAADHPELKELTPLLSRPIDSDEVQAVVKKYYLRKGYKFDSGSFTSEDQAYTLMYREDRIVHIILQASPWPKGCGDVNWTVYLRPLPGNLKPTDSRKDVEAKLGKPIEPDGDRWIDKTMLLWVHFAERDAAIEEVWVSAAPAKP